MDHDPGKGSAETVASSPTLNAIATQAGMILGTAAYMSPEQANGVNADARSDIFSFGCILFEMLTGQPPFGGATAPEIMASVLAREPNFDSLPSALDSRVVELLRRCLEKNPKLRWQAAGDLRWQLEWILASPASGSRRAFARQAVVIGLAAIILSSVTAAVTRRLKPATTPAIARFAIYPPTGYSFASSGRIGASATISPDGKHVVFSARHTSGVDRLFFGRSMTLRRGRSTAPPTHRFRFGRQTATRSVSLQTAS
jgi:eukaryotic-like serine/threonine-protein kinase